MGFALLYPSYTARCAPLPQGSRCARRTLRGKRQEHFHPTLDIADAQLAAMQLGHFLDEVEAQAGAFAAAAGARQGVEAFGQARLC